MSSKPGASFRILKKYGFMIDGPKDALTALGRLPKIVEGETFKQWKARLFGDATTEISVYAPYEPIPQTKISTIRRKSGGEYMNLVFARYGRFKDRKANEAVEEAEQELIEKLSTFPRETLLSILDELEDDLQPSVEEFFGRYINSKEENIDTESILRDLIGTYNSVVKQWRKKA
jgi:hypothetical protein